MFMIALGCIFGLGHSRPAKIFLKNLCISLVNRLILVSKSYGAPKLVNDFRKCLWLLSGAFLALAIPGLLSRELYMSLLFLFYFIIYHYYLSSNWMSWSCEQKNIFTTSCLREMKIDLAWIINIDDEFSWLFLVSAVLMVITCEHRMRPIDLQICGVNLLHHVHKALKHLIDQKLKII